MRWRGGAARRKVATMFAFLAPVIALLVSLFLLQIGASLSGTLIPLRGYAEGFPTPLIGALGTAYFGGFVIGCFLAPLLVRRVGYIRSFAALCAISAVAVMVLPLFPDPVIWLVLRVLGGAAASSLYAVIESWLNEKTDREHRGATFSIYQVLMFIGSLSGQNMLGLADVSTPDLFTYATALIVLALVPVAMTRRESPSPPTRVKIDIRWAISMSPIATFGCLCVGLTNGSSWSLAPVFVSSQGFTAQHSGWFMMAFLLGGALGQYPVGWISDRIDRRWVIMGVAAVSGALGLALSFEYGGSFETLAATMFFYGLVSLTIYSLCVAHINDMADPQRRMEIASAMLLFYSVGASIGPLVVSAIIDATTFASLYRFTAVGHGAIAIFAVWRMIRRPRTPTDDRASFVVTMPRTAPVVSDLDPMMDEPDDKGRK
ncbi:MAG: MFS transporter [Rhodospirillales bacterium]